MTSDAKIGLLLGLVFIFIIAFVINGLPFFRNAAGNSNELTTNMVSSPNNSLGIGPRTRDVPEVFGEPSTPSVQPTTQVLTPQQQEARQTVRFEIPIPTDIAKDNSSAPVETTVTEQQSEPVAAASTPPQVPAEVAKTEPAKPEPPKPQTVKRAVAKTYEVADGDNLAGIAKKFYGEEEGNKMVNIERIFKANREVMKSIDRLSIGMKLVIPPLDSGPDESILGSLFEKVSGIGSKRTQTPAEKPAPAPALTRYVVKEGDNLWRIASTQLGDGNRLEEIFRLNRDIMKDKDSLSVGMSLRMPR